MNLLVFDALTISMAEGDTSPGTVSPALFGAHVHLYGQNLSITKGTLLADLVAIESSYPGYAAGAVAWGPVTVADDGSFEVLGIVPPFVPTGSDSTQLAWGIFVTNHVPALVLAGPFDMPPLDVTSPMNPITVTLRHRPGATEPVAVIS